ncbi:HYDIN protein, partial [Cercotrichas coryphoeus]|nr:HYDIN protein [Cercotrichas coryphoeus]
VNVSATAVYSKYSIEPGPSIDFGAMIKTTKKTQIVVLENRGMLSFEFRIHQAPEDASALESERYKKPCTTLPPLLELFLQDRLTVGMFTVSPCSGSVAAWDQQDITVDCLAGQEGTCEEQLYIDITGR